MRLPFFFDRTFSIQGESPNAPSFFLKVRLKGRCLMAEEQPEEMGARWWYYGVNPGGIAGSGESVEAARVDFFDRMHSVLVDLAGDAETYESFATSVQAFIAQVSAPEEREWRQAREEVRAGRSNAEGYRRVTDDPASGAEVELFVEPQRAGAIEVENATFDALVSPSSAEERILLAAA